ncbi:MAG: type I restriction endonuclease subunit R [Acidovorax sp.]|nr:type I restriction endonuclease subunit R [Acidovorax sp.]
MPNFISEDDIEQALLQRLQHVCGFDVLNCHTTDPGDINDGSGRKDKREVLLPQRLKAAAMRLNPQIPEATVDEALARLADRRQAMSLVAANREVDGLLRDGIPVTYEDAQGRRQQEQLKLIDFNTANVTSNEFLAVSQLWVKCTGTTALADYRRPDVLIYVNGIPLVFVELKNSNIKLRSAYSDNLTNYKHDIPQLFITNAFCVLSNAVETRLGSLTGQWEHFFGWLRINDEKEKVDRVQIAETGTSLERLIEGLFPKERLLDYVENFVLFHRETNKILAQNHQFIGVNHALAQFEGRNAQAKGQRGKLGVFWHTQGSGKSFSMVFYVRKIFRKLTGNFSFVVVTDRDDLDGQIYRNFLNTGTVKAQDAAQPKNSEELRKFLGQNKRLVFTLIQKFRFDKGAKYPVLSDRDDIVVIVDEAHRTQYKTLAENMRAGLPNASYLAFTGTPLLGRERKTNEWFGDYVSEYTFQQSMEDGATVPLFYQKRVPEMLIQNEDLSEEFYQIIEEENIDEAQQEKLEKRFATEMQVITRDDRLETIAKDIAYHFPRRGYLGKGMVVTVDKFTAVKMFDKVQRLWKEDIKALLGRIAQTPNDVEKQRLKKTVEWMRKVEMAVVISEEAGENEKFAARGLNIAPHRERMNRLDAHMADIEGNFKDEANPLQLVFVCAMWLTGFDAPSLSTLYLDKPMKDHTLMQTIARANRVTPWKINGVEKTNGEIVDYYNVFRNMKKALKDYAQGEEGLDEPPVRDKEVLFTLLDDAIEQALAYCEASDIGLRAVLARQDVFTKLGAFNQFANTLLASDELRRTFYVYENTVSSLYEACKPEVLARGAGRTVAAMAYLRGVTEALVEQQDIDKVAQRVSELLDESVVVNNAEGFKAKEFEAQYEIIKRGRTWDLSKIDFEKLRHDFGQAIYKNIEIADLRGFISRKLELMLAQNSTRGQFAQRFQQIIENYNAGGSSTEQYFEQLVQFSQDMRTEDERHIREGLTEDELEIYDLLKKEVMTKAETQKVKLAAKALLHRLQDESPRVLVQDWYKTDQTRRIVRTAVAEVLDRELPVESYDRALFQTKCDNVFHLVLDHAAQGRKWAA